MERRVPGFGLSTICLDFKLSNRGFGITSLYEALGAGWLTISPDLNAVSVGTKPGCSHAENPSGVPKVCQKDSHGMNRFPSLQISIWKDCTNMVEEFFSGEPVSVQRSAVGVRVLKANPIDQEKNERIQW